MRLRGEAFQGYTYQTGGSTHTWAKRMSIFLSWVHLSQSIDHYSLQKFLTLKQNILLSQNIRKELFGPIWAQRIAATSILCFKNLFVINQSNSTSDASRVHWLFCLHGVRYFRMHLGTCGSFLRWFRLPFAASCRLVMAPLLIFKY